MPGPRAFGTAVVSDRRVRPCENAGREFRHRDGPPVVPNIIALRPSLVARRGSRIILADAVSACTSTAAS
jgi:hypothetical protein